MRPFIVICFLLINFINAEAQSPLNLDMEIKDSFTSFPKGWIAVGNKNLFSFKLDSAIKQHGNYSFSVENKVPNSNTSPIITYPIKAVYAGEKLTIKGFIKTQNLKNGYVGLIIDIKAGKKDNFKTIGNEWVDFRDLGIKNTSNWKSFKIETEYDEVQTDSIFIRVMLNANGKIWLDNLKIQIDNQDISIAPTKIRTTYNANLDTTYRNSSGIETITITNQLIKNLSNLGMLWGFLKYYHPLVVKGNYNWDAELFRILPKVITANDGITANKIMENWVDSLGVPPKCSVCVSINADGKIKLMPDYGLLFRVGNLSQSLIKKLDYILHNRSAGFHYYVRLDYYGSPDFKNEVPYNQTNSPDAGVRLLALYRYWNIIQYYYPYRHLMEEDWVKVLTEFIPKFINANNAVDYNASCAELITRIHDSHASTASKTLQDTRGRYFSPIKATFIDNQLIVSGFYSSDTLLRQKVKLGDIIIEVDGKQISSLIKELLPLTGASNYPTIMLRLQQQLLRGVSPTCTYKILRDGKVTEVSIERVLPNSINKAYNELLSFNSSFKILEDNIGYFFPATYKDIQLENVKESFKNTKGIIIDFRCYPSDCTMCLFRSMFNLNTPVGRYTKGDVNTAGLFTIAERFKIESEIKNYYKGKVVVLVNEITQSQAEGEACLLGYLPNATIVGSTTAGANGDVVQFYFPSNVRTQMTGIGVERNDGSWAQRKGVKIDVVVKPTLKGIKEGRDELLERAIQIVGTGK